MEDMLNLSEREKNILFTLIRNYIITNEPIGSRTLSKKLDLELSSATIRNIMADLEEKGFLQHPHTSAGRVPTENGYRLFVNHVIDSLKIKNIKSLNGCDLQLILMKIKERAKMLSKISSILSELSHHVGIVLAPNVSQLTLKHLDFVDMGGKLCVAIFVSQSGLVFNRIIEMEDNVSQEQFDKMSRYVNEEFQGLTLSEIKRKINKIMSEEKNLYNRFICQSIELSQKAIEKSEGTDIYINGHLNILDHPEFSAPERMRSFFTTLEKKDQIISLIDHYLETEGLRVLIGSENMNPEMVDYSFVLSTYHFRPSVKGVIGVIGPMRMRYWEVISVVDHIALLMTRIFLQEQFGY